MTVDRRVLRTRNALYDALVALIRERGYPAITVQDILERADVGRSTFYAHFTSKDDLLANSLERLGHLLHEAGGAEAPSGSGGWSLTLFAHVDQYREIYVALSGIAAGDTLRAAVRRVLAEFVRPRLDLHKDVPTEVAVAHVTGTFMTVAEWWLIRRPRHTPEEADRLFRQLLAGAVGLRS